MKLIFDSKKLLSLMQDFHTLTGIRMVLFDAGYDQVLSYPDEDCSFCRLMKTMPQTAGLCKKSDALAFETCRRTRSLHLYHCHANLIEATIPILDQDRIIAYLMFGQVSDSPSRTSQLRDLTACLSGYGISSSDHLFRDLPRKTTGEILAAGKIMEACTLYAVYQKAISASGEAFVERLDRILLSDLSRRRTSDDIAREMQLSRSALYQQCDRYLGLGIASYLRRLQMREARRLLETTDLPIADIAEKTGFHDYNYFCRVFRRENGISPGRYRESQSKET